MRLAVFGDVHGKLAQMTLQVALWEAKHDESIHAVLQVGDMGLFEEYEKADSTTKSHVEAGLSGVSYLRVLDGDLPLYRTYFTRGNHEDFEFLADHQDETVDPQGRLMHLRDATIRNIGTHEDQVLIAGLGGIEPAEAKPTMWEAHVGARYVDPDAVDLLLDKEPGSVDVLLTHDAPWGYGLEDNPETGSRMVREVVEHLQPRFHFYGHYHDPPEPFQLGDTRCVGLHQDVDQLDGWGAPAVLDTSDWSLQLPEDHGRETG